MLWAVARSRKLTVFVLVMASTYVLVLAAFGVLVEARWLDIIAGLYPFVLLYALFFLNLVACGISWSPAIVRRCWREQSFDPLQTALGPWTEVTAGRLRIEDLTRRLRRRGFAVRESDCARGSLFHASRGRFSEIGTLLFHAGFLLLLAGAVTNFLTRFEGTAIIAEGGSFSGARQEYRTLAEPLEGALPQVDFDVAKVTAEFWESKVFFTTLEAQLVHRAGREIARLSNAVRIGETDVSISGFGYTPLVELKDRSGEILAHAQIRLNVFPPGTEDYFRVPGLPHKIFVSFYPDHANVTGRPASKSMDPVNPAYFVRILRGRIPVHTGLLKPGEWAQFDGLSISFPSFVRSGDFRIVRNPGHPFVWIAFVAMGLGIAWRLLFYRKEVTLRQDEAGRIWLCGRFDYFPKLNGEWLASLAREFGSAK